jgi:hypothetical protein
MTQALYVDFLDLNEAASRDDACGDEASASAPLRVVVRGIDDVGAIGPHAERMPTAQELMGLPPHCRVDALWDSGVSPNTPELVEVFLSVENEGLRGWCVAASVQTGLPPNPRLYRGEHRHNTVIWPDGPPAKTARPKGSRRPTRAEQEKRRKAVEREASLFRLMPCGCIVECLGEAHHEAAEAEQDRIASELAQSRFDFAELLVRATQRGR